MRAMAASLGRFVDVRRGEGTTLVRAAAALFLLITGHTALETARDALVLTAFPARDLALVYVAVAIGVLPASALTSRAVARLGTARTLRAGLVACAGLLVTLFLAKAGTATLLALYVTAALVGTVVVPLFWTLLGAIFSVTQGRRLLGPVSAAGLLGAASGSLVAVAAVRFAPVNSLLLVTAAALAIAYFVLPRAEPVAARESPGVSRASVRGEPFLRRIALLVALSTVTFLLLDYSFKTTLAHSVAPERLPAFVARYYAALNVLALVLHAAIVRLTVRRASLSTALLVTPVLFVAGAVACLAAGGARAAVLAIKGVDGTVRHSLHRVASELLYFPLSPEARARAKPLIDGALVRTIQGALGLVLFGAGIARPPTPRVLGIALLLVAMAWLATAWTTRAPYLALLRRSVVGETYLPFSGAKAPLDLETAEGLVEHLSHEDPRLVEAAMNALAGRGRLRLVPGLILLHDNDAVLTRALSLFGESSRTDWYALARKRLVDPRESIRRAAGRALAQHSRLDPKDVADEPSAAARGYAAVHAALARDGVDPVGDAMVAALLARTDAAGDDARLGMLAAIGLSKPNARLESLLRRLAAERGSTREWRMEVAQAARAQRAAYALPVLVSLLDHRDGRDVVRSAIASFGADAVRVLRDALRDPAVPRPVRVHVPNTLTRIGTKEAAEALLDTLESGADGLVRYKALCALGRMIGEHRTKVDRTRVERQALKNVIEHFRLLGLRARLDASPLHVPTRVSGRDPTERLLLGMLNDKLRQSLERAFRLIKIAHPHEDIHGVHDAFLSGDKRVRANATELLDTTLRRTRVPRLRALLRVLGEEATIDETLERAAPLLEEQPAKTRDDAIARLACDRDSMIAALARLHAASLAGESARVVIDSRALGAIELAWGGAP